MVTYLVESGKRILDEILAGGNIKDDIPANTLLITSIKDSIGARADILKDFVAYSTEVDVISKMLRENDSSTAEHSFGVAEICDGMAGYLNLNRAIAKNSGLYHDFGKLFIPEGIKNQEMKTGKDIEPFDLEFVRYGHVLIGEVLAVLGEVDEHLKYAMAYHHDKRNHKGYPHKVFELPDETKALQVADAVQYKNIVKVADVAHALTDKNRKNMQWYRRNGVDIQNKYDVFGFLIKGVYEGDFEEKYVNAYLKFAGLKEDEIKELYRLKRPETNYF
ncbi:MAG: HD domain-containing protein [Candidatus Aenigmatarchaeota archaeon]